MAAHQPAELTLSGFGRPAVEWVSQPEMDALPDALSAFIHHRIAEHLRLRGFTPKQLSNAVGGSRPNWTNKLNGKRPFSLADLAVLAFCVEPSIWKALPYDVGGAHDLLPLQYVSLLSHQQLGVGLAQFVTRQVASGAADFVRWWREETESGRGWALTLDVARQRAARELDRCGLPSVEASVGPGDGSIRTVEWTVRAARLRILWLLPVEGSGPTIPQALLKAGQLLWAPRPARGLVHDIVVIAAPQNVVHNMSTALGFESSAPPARTTISLQAADQFGLERVGDDTPDLDVTIHEWGVASPLWLEIKA